MGILLALAGLHLPGSVRRRRLDELFRATAEAFECKTPRAEGRSIDKRLRQYAAFTAANADRAIAEGREVEVKERLHHGARLMGLGIREELRIRTPEDAMRACEIIYRALHVDLHAGRSGDITIRSCFFSSFYSGRVCGVIAGLDEGLVSGLSGGLRLEFSQRITDGGRCCLAHVVTERSSP